LLPLVALVFRRGWLLLLPLVLLPLLPATAEATTWHDLWQRPDQQAAQALHNGDAKQAQQLARNPAWRGVAAYRAGDYASATQSLQHAPGSDPAYNLGNALVKQGQYQQAIAAYDHALKLDPANADAKANRQAVEDWLHQQQKKQQDQQKDKQQQQGKNGDKGQPSSGTQGKDDKAAQDGQPKTQDQQGNDRSGKDQSGDQPKPLTPQQQAEQKAQAEQAQKALKQQMDQALAGQPKDQQATPTHQLGSISKDDPQSKLPADLRQALERVPDDPGALLRRKFELEYLQRHGGAPSESEDDQP
jgi:Ca-activated chloride channel family protein